MFTNIILTGTDFESEGKDRATLELPGKQATLLQDAVRYGEINFDKKKLEFSRNNHLELQ